MSTNLESELEARGAVLRGHFQYASGRHGDLYIEKFRILQWPDITSELCQRIAEHFEGKVNLIAGPTTGGVILSFAVAQHLGLRSIICERAEDGAGRKFRRGFEIGPGDRVLVVDDVLTTGGSIRDVIDAVHARSAEVAGVGVLIDRNNGKTDFGAPAFACLTLDISSVTPDECQLCRDGVELVVT